MRDAPSVAMPVRPLAIGDQVVVWGRRGVITHVARSICCEQPLLTVEFSAAISLRVRPVDCERTQ